MDEPKKPPKSLLPVISMLKWRPDEQAMNVALGKKPDENRDRGSSNRGVR